MVPSRRNGRTERRRFLAAAAAAVGLSGCVGKEMLGVGDPVDATGTPAATPTPTTEPTPTGTASRTPTAADDGTQTPDPPSTPQVKQKVHPRKYTVDIDHPATVDLGKEPTIGQTPDQTGAIIVEFQDISCKVCASFDAQTFPRIYANLIQTGKVTFVSRDFPHTKDWTYPATQALDATYERDGEAYWSLKSRYYAHQHEYTMDNIYSRTRRFLRDHTRVDADAVLRDVRAEAYSEALERDLRAKENAGVQGTPTFFLFRDNEFVTELTGNQNYKVFKKSLGY